MPKISVIVPIYNTEKYLPRCIDSILAQTYTGFELILINDGSTDNSGAICDEYAAKDKRIIVVHKENGGVSSARNQGIKIAKGEWIMFVDSDDYILKKHLQSFFNIDSNVEFKIGGMETFGNEIISISPISQNIIRVNIINSNYRYINIYSPCSKLYKRKIIINNCLKFDKNITVSEDLLFNLKYLLFCKCIELCPYAIYKYNKVEDFIIKHPLTVCQIKYNLEIISQSIIQLEKHFNINCEKIKESCFQLQFTLFQSQQNLLSKEEQIKNWRYYRKNKLYRYRFKMNIKERMFLYLNYTFPKLTYIFFKKYK